MNLVLEAARDVSKLTHRGIQLRRAGFDISNREETSCI